MEVVMELAEVFNSLHGAIAFDCRDWGQDKRSAWIYGIIVGWDDDSYGEFKQKFRWSNAEISRNKMLNSVVNKVISV